MKQYYKIATLGILASVVLGSCAKYETLDYRVDKPLSIANQEQIDSYKSLKSYVDSVKYPNFKFGAAINLNEYVSKGVMYRLINSNFNDITAGYEMKHSSIVRNDGTLNLTNIENLYKAAAAAKVSVFGHTLAWHSGQNATYLNRLIAPLVIPGASVPTWDLVTGANFETDAATNYSLNANAVPSFTAAGTGAGGTGRALKVTNASVRTNDYDAQLFIRFSPAVVAGEKYELVMDIKADAAATIPTQAHVTPGAYKHWDFFGQLPFTTAWTKYTRQITVTADMATSGAIAFNLGKFATSFYFDNITLKKYNEKGSGNAGYAYFATNPAAINFWEAQFVHDITPLQNAQEYTLKFAAKGSVAGNIRAELQSTSNYSSNSFGTIALTPGWKEYTMKVTTTAAGRNRLVFSHGDYVGTVTIDNVKLMLGDGPANLIPTSDFETGSGAWGGWGPNTSRGRTADGGGFGGALDQIIEKTTAEKKTIITNAMKDFISKYVEFSKPYVKAWDVVNEPMDDGRPYELKTGIGRSTIAADEFFWQDYMGKDYAVEAFKLARLHGNPTDIHFINDYNLEYSMDKCKGLIEYVKYIESKGAKVDGIGTQMHISTTSDKAKIEEMFRLLAATGKLIKVSELDMGINNKKTTAITEEDLKVQEAMYKFVVEKYFEIIPAAQRYGITIWSPLDSPVNSFWRAGEPIGLWTEGMIRKPSYMGVAEGLKNK